MWSDWLVFCDCGFHSVCPQWRKIRSLWKLPDSRDWLRGKLDLVLMGQAMLSKYLIQFSVVGWSCVPSLLFTRCQTMVEVMKITVTSFKRSYACTDTLSAPNPAAGHHWPMPLGHFPGHSKGSLGEPLGSLIFLLGPGAHKFLFVPSKSLFPIPALSFGSSVVGLMATSSKRGYATLKSAAPRAPAPAAVHGWPIPPKEMFKHSFVSVSVGFLGPGVHKVCLSTLKVSGRNDV